MSINKHTGKPNDDFRIDVLELSPRNDQKNEKRDTPNDGNNNTTLSTSRENDTEKASTNCEIILLILPIFAYIYDLVSDLCLIIEYFVDQAFVYGSLTLAFTLIPMIASRWMSTRMYEGDSQVQALRGGEQRNDVDEVERSTDVVRDSPFQLLWRQCRSLRFAVGARKCKKQGDIEGLHAFLYKMRKEEADVALLNVIESSLESAPQLLLQLSILLTQNEPITLTMWFKIIAGCITLSMLGWAMRKYHCAIRLAQSHQNLPVISWCGGVLIFVWHFGTITSRVFLIGIAASFWPLYALLACTVISAAWTVWLYSQEGVFEFCRDKTVSPLTHRTTTEQFRTVLFAAILAVVYIFTYVNLKDGRTCVRYVTYYILYALQNLAIFMVWAILIHQTVEDRLHLRIVLLLSFVLFIIGLAAMFIYYNYFHPTMENRSCLFSISFCSWERVKF